VFQYAILGHSGEGHKFDIVKVNAPPKNNKERLAVIEVHSTDDTHGAVSHSASSGSCDCDRPYKCLEYVPAYQKHSILLLLLFSYFQGNNLFAP